MVQIIGWLGFVAAVLVVGSGILELLMGSTATLIMGLITIVIGLPMLFWGSGVKKYKKWTWYFGVIYFSLGTLYYIFIFITTGFGIFNLIGFLYAVFVVVVLTLNKGKFFTQAEPSTPTVIPSPVVPALGQPVGTPGSTMNSPINAPVNVPINIPINAPAVVPPATDTPQNTPKPLNPQGITMPQTVTSPAPGMVQPQP